jgi:hypothetical protein
MANDNLKWFHLNRYNALAACEHCQGVIRHEPWCRLSLRSCCTPTKSLQTPAS